MTGLSPHISDYAVVYRWWSHSTDKRVWRHIDVPIILSIATLRLNNPSLAVYVMDYSGGYDWGDFPSRLNFSVISIEPSLETSLAKKDLWSLPNTNPYTGRGPLESASDKAEHTIDALDVRSCSWPIDMSEVCLMLPERYIVSSDCDVFWLKPVLPLEGDGDKFNARPANTGLFFFDKLADAPRQWLELWQAYVSLAARDFNFRRRLIELYPHPAVILSDKPYFYVRDKFPRVFEELVNPTEPYTCLLPSDHFGYGFEKEFVGKVMGRWKGKFPLLFAEVFDQLREVFSVEELIDVFQMDVFNNSVFSLENLCDSSHSDFYDHLSDRMYAEIRPL
jgi:hypothetical protein